jgi:hypothetical protein
MSEFFELPNGKAVCFNPGGRWHGWLFYRHPDGQLVSERKLETTKPYPDDHPLAALFDPGRPVPHHGSGPDNYPPPPLPPIIGREK